MKRINYICLFICLLKSIRIVASESDIKIPSKMKFADMTLIITNDAKSRIAAKIQNLVSNEKLFTALLNRVTLFMPIIEKILKEEGVPNDFKYIPIQESAMISDADDTKSLGFWQFKPGTAQDVNLRMDHLADERVHIIEATKGAARYLKINNRYLDNWLCTLLAYNRGRGWVEQGGYKKYCSVKQMKIDNETHWYIIHFLAHKLVFEKRLRKCRHPELYLHEHDNAGGKSLSDIAQRYKIDEEHLRSYNKWMKHSHVPHDKNYAVIVPLPHNKKAEHYSMRISNSSDEVLLPSNLDYSKYVGKATNFPKVNYGEDSEYRKSNVNEPSQSKIKRINGLWGVFAEKGDTIESLALIGSISVDDFMRYNDIDASHVIVEGHPYYFEAKRRSAQIHFHIVRSGDTWWYVSQKYGIKQSALMMKNREKHYSGAAKSSNPPDLEINRVLWMRFIRPAKVPIAHSNE
jgi:membrane-bound lytic murein transglycosylase D